MHHPPQFRTVFNSIEWPRSRYSIGPFDPLFCRRGANFHLPWLSSSLLTAAPLASSLVSTISPPLMQFWFFEYPGCLSVTHYISYASTLRVLCINFDTPGRGIFNRLLRNSSSTSDLNQSIPQTDYFVVYYYSSYSLSGSFVQRTLGRVPCLFLLFSFCSVRLFASYRFRLFTSPFDRLSPSFFYNIT